MLRTTHHLTDILHKTSRADLTSNLTADASVFFYRELVDSLLCSTCHSGVIITFEEIGNELLCVAVKCTTM